MMAFVLYLLGLPFPAWEEAAFLLVLLYHGYGFDKLRPLPPLSVFLRQRAVRKRMPDGSFRD